MLSGNICLLRLDGSELFLARERFPKVGPPGSPSVLGPRSKTVVARSSSGEPPNFPPCFFAFGLILPSPTGFITGDHQTETQYARH